MIILAEIIGEDIDMTSDSNNDEDELEILRRYWHDFWQRQRDKDEDELEIL